MSHIPDDKLFAHGARAKGKVVVITGAANGIGKETALRFASFGAKVVIGDLDLAGAEKTVAEIERNGGTAVCIKCNVTVWSDQTALFELAMAKYGAVDVVIPNAGVNEISRLGDVQFKDGHALPPNLKTLEINFTGVLYTAHLAIHYLQVNHDVTTSPGALKALIFIGSMASWLPIPAADLYTASKHGVLGVMRALHPILEMQGIRVGCIHPFFADTNIVPLPVKLVLAGIPLTPVPRVAGAFFYAATDPDWSSNGSAWLLADDGPVFMVPKEEFKLGVYKMIDDRVNAARAALTGTTAWWAFFRDVFRIVGKPVLAVGLGAIATGVAWSNNDAIDAYVRSYMA